jgi:hypothetical protein
MADRDVLQRIDAHMERGNQLLGDIRAEHRLNRAAFHELRDVTRSAVVTMTELAEESRGVQRRLDDMGDEIRANTRAVLHVLDQLRGEGPEAPGTA